MSDGRLSESSTFIYDHGINEGISPSSHRTLYQKLKKILSHDCDYSHCVGQQFVIVYHRKLLIFYFLAFPLVTCIEIDKSVGLNQSCVYDKYIFVILKTIFFPFRRFLFIIQTKGFYLFVQSIWLNTCVVGLILKIRRGILLKGFQLFIHCKT